MSAEQPGQSFHERAEGSLRRILGDSGAKSILFYIGEFEPGTFEGKLRSILGDGAALIISDMNRGEGERTATSKRRWLGLRASAEIGGRGAAALFGALPLVFPIR